MAKIEALGSGLFTTAALFNHSCHPNIMRVNVGRRMVSAPPPHCSLVSGHYQVSVACRDIPAGEEVTDCYGLPWYSVARERRQHVTSRSLMAPSHQP